jgi:hypothetical protein
VKCQLILAVLDAENARLLQRQREMFDAPEPVRRPKRHDDRSNIRTDGTGNELPALEGHRPPAVGDMR